MSTTTTNPQIHQYEKSADSAFVLEVQSVIGPWPMQLVVLSAVMTEAMMLPMIWRIVFHVSLLFFMVLDVF